jgi:hypothetical protein
MNCACSDGFEFHLFDVREIANLNTQTWCTYHSIRHLHELQIVLQVDFFKNAGLLIYVVEVG